MREYHGHAHDTTACVFLPDDGSLRHEHGGAANMIATASKDETIKIYDQANGECCDFASYARCSDTRSHANALKR